MKRFLSIVLLLVLAPLSQNWASELTKDSGLSQSTSADSGSQINKTLQLQDNLNNETHPLQVHEAFPLSVVVIDDQTLVISWLIKENYYLYKDKMSFVADGAKIENINFPEAKLKQDEFFGQVRVYEKPIEILVTLSEIQNDVLPLNVEYQGCWNGGVCYPPQNDLIRVSLSGAEAIQSQPAESINNEELKAKELFQQGGLALFFGALLAGLALSWTPCVYPMIPILSGIIIGQKQTPSTIKAFLMSLAFVLSMSLAYGLIGATAGYFGAGINLQAIMQTPWILAVFSLIFIFLAFSMFGFYDIQLPIKLQNKLTQLSNKQTGGEFVGVSIMGFLSALIVGPCVTPFLATALSYVIAGGSAIKGGISLFAMGLGMGIPILIICGWGVNALPKAGPWMNTIKNIFGFLMMAVALYLLDRILNPIASLVLWASLLTIAPIKLGAFSNLTKTNGLWHLLVKAAGLIVLGYGLLLWLLVIKGGGDIQQHIESLIYGENIKSSESIQFQIVESENQINLAISETENSNKLLVIKFYADWCVSCNKLERVVFSNSNVIQTLQSTLALTADVTANNKGNQQILARFNLVGPPAILFFKDGKEQRSHRIIGEISATDFLEHINSL
jgi:thiol:disulfide interchange protein DsbD